MQLCIRMISSENTINDLFPILCKVISSVSSKILYGIVILAIAGLMKAINTVAVEWNPKLPTKISIERPSINAYISRKDFDVFKGRLIIRDR